MTRVSLLLPFMATEPTELLRYAALAADGRATRLWQGQAVTLEPLQGFAYAAGAGLGVPVGLSVTLMPMKHPFLAAIEARTLAQVTGHSLIYGLGPGPTVFQEYLAGAPYRSQLGAVRDYVHTVRALLTGAPQADSPTFPCGMALHPMDSPPVHLGLGVLRPRMAHLAGEIADVAITWLAPAAYVAATISPALRSGADQAGRSAPDVVAVIPLALRRPERNPYRLVLASNYGHLHGPHYQDMLAQAGIAVDTARPGPTAKAVLDGGAFLYDDVPGLRQRIADYAAAGVTEVVLNLTGVHNLDGPDAAYDEALDLLAALG